MRSPAISEDNITVISDLGLSSPSLLIMKRLRSYDDDLDSVGEKGVCKDWGRRDQDLDRSSSHRRFYSKAENGRKGLSSSSGYDRLIDDDREASRSLRKRLDHDSDGFDRRKSFDRYRDSSDRGISISTPRSVYGTDRINRSESFSGSRREFPKGFRSERDRSWREESVSSWRKYGGSKDVDEDTRFGADSGRGSRVPSEDRVNVRSPQGLRDVKSPSWSKDSGGEQSKSVDLKKNEEMQVESDSSSEMEEGELEPEPKLLSESEPEAKAPVGMNTEEQKEFETEHQVKSEMKLDDEVKSSPEKKMEFNKEGACDGKQEVGALETVTNVRKEINELPNCQNKSFDEPGGSREEATDNGVEDKEESIRDNQDCLSSPNPKPEGHSKDGTIEDTSSEKSLPLEGQQEDKGIYLEVEVKDIEFPDSNNEVAEENKTHEVTVTLTTDKSTHNARDKGKTLVVSPSIEADSTKYGGWMERDLLGCRDNAMEGPSSRGFELFFNSAVMRPERTNHSIHDKHKDEKLILEPLDLSLGLPYVTLPLSSHDPIPAPNSPSRARSFQSLPTTFRTNSDGFTASMSFSGSQTFVHNPSCSLTQNSFDNYEQSVGSHPIFQGVDQVSHGSWQGQSLNEPKRKEVPLLQRTLLNGNGSQASQSILNGQAVQGQHLKFSEGNSGRPIALDRQSSLQRQLLGVQPRHHDEVRSPTQSVGSHETRSEYSQDKKRVMREKSGGSLFRSSSQREMEQLLVGGTGFVERILTMIVSEPIRVMARRIHELTEQSIACVKKSACEMIVNKDNHGQLSAFQKALENRSDLTLETLSKAHRAQLEILVALKTGLQDFVRQANNITSSDLAEIFLNLKCRNLACMMPLDDCDCKVCGQKNGFCSACMCLVCSKFDMASNTCSWVGCDVCLHWCHTDCGLRESYIRNGQSVTGAQGPNEMQFHCVACDHPSEMFGFVKEVFKTFAEGWKAETLSKELEYVKRIFCDSNDVRGKQLHNISDQMLARLENKLNCSEVYNHIMGFFTESDSNFGNASTPKNQGERSNEIAGPSQEARWLTPVSAQRVPRVENAVSVPPSLDWDRMDRRAGDSELQMSTEKKHDMDELESIVRIKQAEAKMFQARADDARREADGLKRIAIAKNEKIEEEYASRITKLHLAEAEERRRKKLEELQVLERAHHEYFNMKKRMEADIKDLLLKMEATRRNLIT